MTPDNDISPGLRSEATARQAEQEAERPVLEAALGVEIIIILVAIFAAGWCLWDDVQEHKAEKKIHQIEQRQ